MIEIIDLTRDSSNLYFQIEYFSELYKKSGLDLRLVLTELYSLAQKAPRKSAQSCYLIGEKEWVLAKVYCAISQKHLNLESCVGVPYRWELKHKVQEEHPPTRTLRASSGNLNELLERKN